MTQSIPILSRSGKFLAWFSLVSGVITIAAPLMLQFILKQPFYLPLTFIVLGLAGIIGGYFGLKANIWAFWLLCILYFIQIVAYVSPSFSFSFIGPLAIKFSIGSNVPPSSITFNFLALIIFFFAFKNASSLTHPSSETHKSVS